MELVAPAVTSPGPIPDPAIAAATAAQLRLVSPHIKYVDLFRRGYGVLDLNRERAQGEIYHLDTVDERSSAESLAAVFVSESGANALQQTPTAAPSPALAEPAPID